MKIDPATGKTYLHEWDLDLNRIHQAGFSYGYVEIMDLPTGEHFWQVDAVKGEGQPIFGRGQNMTEAVAELKRALSARS